MKLRLLLAVVLLLVSGITAAAYRYLRMPYAGFDEPALLTIERGTSSREMARLLASHGIVSSEYAFLAARVLRPRATLQAGEYHFADPASPWEVLDRIVRGDIHYYELRVPEGSNIFDTARLVAETGLVSGEEFLEAARDPSLVRDLAPEASTLEGYLFPSTYRLTRSATATEIARTMVDQFSKVWRELGSSPHVHQTVTLASLIEKETGVPSERPLVSAVFHNRLARGMSLACDPTVIYAALLEGVYDGVINQSDLNRRHPYNTYLNPGLPPGPIASPGAAALRAAIAPAASDALFFVAKPDGSGEHVFSQSAAAHNRAVREYRRGRTEAARQTQAP